MERPELPEPAYGDMNAVQAINWIDTRASRAIWKRG